MTTPSTDLYCLVGLALWSVPLAHLPAIARMRAAGTAWGIGNRDQQPPVPEWVTRADRAHKNLVDNLPLYAVAILAVVVSGRCDSISALASAVLLGARIAHSALYIGGVTALGLRSGAYFVALASCVVILTRLCM